MKQVEFVLNNDNYIARDHTIYDIRILPGVALLDAIIRAHYSSNEFPLTFNNILFKEPIAIDADNERVIKIIIDEQQHHDVIKVVSETSEHLTAIVEKNTYIVESFDIPFQTGTEQKNIAMHDLYQMAEKWGIKHGTFMRALGEVRLADDHASLTLQVNPLAQEYNKLFILHPTLLDAATFSALALQYEKYQANAISKPYIPIYIEQMVAYGPLRQACHVYAQALTSEQEEINKLNIVIKDNDNQTILTIKNFNNKRINQQNNILQLLNSSVTQTQSIQSVAKPITYDFEKIQLYLYELISQFINRPCEMHDINTGFFDLGMDSISIMSVINALEKDFTIELYPTLLFEKNTIKKLCDYLVSRLKDHTPLLNTIDRNLNLFKSIWVESHLSNHKLNQRESAAYLFFSNRLSVEEVSLHSAYVVTNCHSLDEQALRLLSLNDNKTLYIINLLPLETENEVTQQLESGLFTLYAAIQKNKHKSIVYINCCTDEMYGRQLGEMTIGLARCLMHEMQGVRLRSIVLSGKYSNDQLIKKLLAECHSTIQEELIYYRGNNRLIKQFQKFEQTNAVSVQALKKYGKYVITGGLGGIGKLIATHLIHEYQAQVLLLGRRIANDADIQWMAHESIKLGQLQYQSVDVCDTEKLTSILLTFAGEAKHIDGIFHTAGILEDQLICTADTESVLKTLAPKVFGTLAIERAIAAISVDFVMLFSSLSAILGNIGQASYASANAFLDSFSHSQQNSNSKWLSVNWPLWNHGGMHISDKQIKHLEEQWGLFPLSHQEGIALIEQTLALGAAQIIPLPEKALPLIKNDLCNEIVDDNHIAIIGLAGQYPNADDIEEFWENLVNAVDCIGDLTTRFKHSPYPWSGLLRTIKQFDANFFQISPADAACMDPQERLFLQVAWQCLESAGYAAEHTRHNQITSVFVGAMFSLYQLHGTQSLQDKKSPDSSFASLANRVSYFLNLTGPSFTLDSMCSSSFTALHLACQQLRAREIDMALVGGVNVISHPAKFNTLINKQFLSSTGRCRAFGEDGDGYVPGEGVGAVLLKPLQKSLQDGDTIHGIIMGTAVNHGGRSAGYTVPTASAQSKVIQSAINQADIPSDHIRYIEAHGTGTALGDPIEIEALKQNYGHSQASVYLGSVKSNIGHLESAAGIASLTKVLLQYKYKMLVPTLHIEKTNKAIDFNSNSFKLVDKVTKVGANYLSAISCFGAGGSNAHIILAPPPQIDHQRSTKPAYLFCFSAKTEESLKKYIKVFSDWIVQNQNVYNLEDICFTLNATRPHFKYRNAFVAESIQLLLLILDAKLASKAQIDTQDKYVKLLNDSAEIYLSGQDVDWQTIYCNKSRKRLPLPTYVFSKDEYWITEPSVAHSDDIYTMNLTLENIPVTNIENVCQLEGVNAPIIIDNDLHNAENVITRMSEGVSSNTRIILLADSNNLEQVFYLFGMINSYQSVYPHIDYQVIALDKQSNKTNIINNEFSVFGQYRRLVVYKDGKRQVANIDDVNDYSKNFNPFIKTHGTYLITGGLGQIGYQLSSYLADTYNVNIILVGRSHSNDESIRDKLSQLSQRRAKVIYFQADITELSSVQALKASVEQRFGELDGILHLAGEIQVKSSSSAKTRGAANLDEIFATEKLDWFIIFGSLSSIAGYANALTYSMENGWLNGFYYHRENLRHNKQRAGNTYILNWPWWQGTTSDSLKQSEVEYWLNWSFANQGLRALNFQQGFALLENTITHYPSGIYFPFVGDKNKFKNYLLNLMKTSIELPTSSLDNTDIKSAISSILKIDKDKISTTATWMEMGFDSVSLTQLVSEVSKCHGVTIAPTIFFNYQNLEQLEAYLSQQSQRQVNEYAVPLLNVPDAHDDVVIVGMAAKLPQCDTLHDFWQALEEGRDLISDVPSDRWFANQCDSAEIRAGFINNVASFEHEFFSIIPDDVKYMDPQQRLLLQTTWQALEDAGIDPDQLHGQQCGVFIGAQFNEYQQLIARESPLNIASVIGNAHTFLANRISNYFDVTGPSEVVDTACSSSLVALHRAVCSIRRGECESAIVGGVSLFLDPDTLVLAKKMGIISPDNVCRPFDKNANGYVKGEGVIVLCLTTRSVAKKNGYSIYGVIKGSGVNHNGKATSLTAPKVATQKKLLKDVYTQVNIPIASISYWEAHGTGTVLGDPLEVQAIIETYQELNHNRSNIACTLGSVKANIGHLEPASGLAGMLKVLLMFKYNKIPPQANFETFNPYIQVSELFKISTKTVEWKNIMNTDGTTYPLRAGVSSFGFGGTNAHVILEQFSDNKSNANRRPKPYYLLVLSAHSKAALDAKKQDLINILDEQDLQLSDVAHTLALGRKHFNFRCIWVVCSLKEIKQFDPLSYIENDGHFHTNSSELLPEFQDYLEQRLQSNDILSTDYKKTLLALGKIYCHGGLPKFSDIHSSDESKMISLPGYPFSGKKFWFVNTTNTKNITGFYLPAWNATELNQINLQHVIQDICLITQSNETLIQLAIKEKLPGFNINQICLADYDAQKLSASLVKCKTIWYMPAYHQDHTHDLESLLLIMHALISLGLTNEPLTLRVLTNNSYHILGNENGNPLAAGLHGFCQVIAKEFPRWNVAAIDLSYDTITKLQMEHLLYAQSSRSISYAFRADKRYERVLKSTSIEYNSDQKAFIHGGIYIILGGAGRIGLHLAEHLLMNYAASVILIGRRELTGDMQSRLSKLSHLPGDIVYHRADIANPIQFKQKLIELNAVYKGFDAIIHSAMVYSETLIQNLDPDLMRESIMNKIVPLNVLNELKDEIRINKIIVFSSAQSFHGNPNRGAYTAACAMQDNYCEHISDSIPISVINWGFWELTQTEDNDKLLAYGITPINAKTGMQAIEVALVKSYKQSVFMQINTAIEHVIGVANTGHLENAVQKQMVGMQRLEILMVKWLWLSLRKSGIDFSRKRENINANIKQARIWSALTNILDKHGYLIEGNANSLSLTSDVEVQREKVKLIREFPELEQHVNLAYLCVSNIIPILKEKLLATDLIFPSGNSILVEKIYSKNPLADYCNEKVAEAVLKYLKQHKNTSVKILEVGAGTGSTTNCILNILPVEHCNNIEYTITDISESVLSYARSNIINKHSFNFKFTKFDIEREPVIQGLLNSEFDIVIASNVIHATKAISTSLKHIKSLLRKDGILVLNECVSASEFLTLTFGLLDGWWHYSDIDLRGDHGPLISQEKWYSILKEHGFMLDESLKQSAEHQKVIVAVSDGSIAHTSILQNRISPVVNIDRNDSVVDFVAEYLHINVNKINSKTKLTALGIDSISSVNFLSAFNSKFHTNVLIANLIQADTIDDLVRMRREHDK